MNKQETRNRCKHLRNVALSALLLSLTVVQMSCSDRTGPLTHGRFTVDMQDDAPADKTAMRKAHGSPMESGTVRNDGNDKNDIKACLYLLKKAGLATPAEYDRFVTFRTTTGSSLGAVPGIYWDYVFYDNAGQVIGTVRKFVD